MGSCMSEISHEVLLDRLDEGFGDISRKQDAVHEILHGKGMEAGMRTQVALNTSAIGEFRKLTWMFVAALVGIFAQIAVGAAVLFTK